MSYDWLKDLKPRDRVIIKTNHQPSMLGTVLKITKHQVVLTNKTRFRIEDGRKVGGDQWCPSSISEATPERREAIYHRNRFLIIWKAFSHARAEDFSVEKIKKIYAIINDQEGQSA